MCNCKMTELIVGIVVVVLALMPTLLGTAATKWVLVIAGGVLIVHSLKCNNMTCGTASTAPVSVKKKIKKGKKK